MQTERKKPMRMCLGCNEMKEKKELMRVVKNAAGDISLDFTGKKPGRGAYLCKNAACLQKARKTKRLERAFQTAIPSEVYDALQEELEKDEGT